MGAKVTLPDPTISVTPQSYDKTVEQQVAVTDAPNITAFTPAAPADIEVTSEPVALTEPEPELSLPVIISDPADSAKVSEEITIVRDVLIGTTLGGTVVETVKATEVVSVIGPKSITTPTQNVKLTIPTPTIITEKIGTVDVEFPGFDVESIGLFGAVASPDNELPQFEVTTTALYGAVGTVNENIFQYYSVSSTGSAYENPTATVDVDIPIFTVDSYGYAGEVGTANVTFPIFAISSTGIASGADGTASIELPLFIVDAYGDIGQALAATDNMAMYAMNTQLMGVTEYASMNAVGLAFHQGKLYMANSNGIWVCDAEGDDGEAIPVLLFRENIDFGSSQVKALTDAYSYVRSTGSHSVRVTARDSGGTGSTTDVHANPHGSKVPLPRGLRSRVFDVLLYAAGDNEFEVNEIELLAEVSHVRRGRQNG